MSHHLPQFDRRTFVIIAVAALFGAGWALLNLMNAGGSGAFAAFESLVWVVFATPFFTFWGWLFARREEGWLAAFVCFCIYFFAILISARIERLILGEQAARDTWHALYFRLTLGIQIFACLGIAAHRAMRRGTMGIST